MQQYVKRNKEGILEGSSSWLRCNEGQLILNPSEEDLIEAGYKKYIASDHENYKFIFNELEHTENETEIIQAWRKHKISRPKKDDLITQKMREKYSNEDETELLRNFIFDGESEEFLTYKNYKKECDIWAEQELIEYDNFTI